MREIAVGLAVFALSNAFIGAAQARSKTGFACAPQKGYVCALATDDRDETRYDIRAASGTPSPRNEAQELCRLRYTLESKNAGLARPQLDAGLAPDAPRAANLKAGLSVVAAIETARQVRIGTARGLELSGPAKSDDEQLYAVALDAPKGRVTLVCFVRNEQFSQALPGLRRLAASIRPPR